METRGTTQHSLRSRGAAIDRGQLPVPHRRHHSHDPARGTSTGRGRGRGRGTSMGRGISMGCGVSIGPGVSMGRGRGARGRGLRGRPTFTSLHRRVLSKNAHARSKTEGSLPRSGATAGASVDEQPGGSASPGQYRTGEVTMKPRRGRPPLKQSKFTSPPKLKGKNTFQTDQGKLQERSTLSARVNSEKDIYEWCEASPAPTRIVHPSRKSLGGAQASVSDTDSQAGHKAGKRKGVAGEVTRQASPATALGRGRGKSPASAGRGRKTKMSEGARPGDGTRKKPPSDGASESKELRPENEDDSPLEGSLENEHNYARNQQEAERDLVQVTSGRGRGRGKKKKVPTATLR